LKGLIAIFFAVVMLASNVSISYATHYCSGKAVKSGIGIIGLSDVDCGMDDGTMSCPIPTSDNSLKTKCCSNEINQLSIDDDYESELVNVRVAQLTVPMFYTLSNSITVEDGRPLVKYHNYLPPFLSSDIPVMIQSFLI
jgi:hypothetical protein